MFGAIGKFFGSITKNKNEKIEGDDFVRIFIEEMSETSYKSLKKEKDLTCQQICQKFQHVFPRKTKKSEFRIVLTLKDPKKDGAIVSKRILSNFEKIFDSAHDMHLKHLHRQYSMIDISEYLMRQSYVPVQINNSDKPSLDTKIEREGLLEIRNVQKKEFKTYRFTLTPEVLIYHSPDQKSNLFSSNRWYKSLFLLLCCLTLQDKLYQILLLYIEQIYVKDTNDPKNEKICFYISTSNKTYQIKCKSNLDRNVWIKSLIHFTNLAKESSIIVDINRRIQQVKAHQFETETRNSIFDKSVVLEDRDKMLKNFEVLLKKHEIFFEHPNSEKISRFFKNIGMMVNELHMAKLNNPHLVKQGSEDEEIKENSQIGLELEKQDVSSQKNMLDEKISEIYKAIQDGSNELDQISHMGWNNLSITNLMSSKQMEREIQIAGIMRFTEDLFYFLQRLSVNKSVFLEEYYKENESKRLKKLK